MNRRILEYLIKNFLRKSLRSLTLLTLFHCSYAFGLDNSNLHPKRIIKPLTEPTTINLSDQSIEDIVNKVYFTHKFKPSENKQFISTNTDAITAQKKILTKILNGKLPETKGIPFDQIRIDFAYYGLGEPELTSLIQKALEKKVSVRVITDFNRSLTYPFTEGQELTSDFAHAKFQDNLTAKTLQSLLDSGMKYGDNLLSPPLMNDFNDKKIIDIFHLKNTYVSIKKADGSYEPVYEFFGTGNMSGGTLRNNTMFETTNKDFINGTHQYFENCVSAFQENVTQASNPDYHQKRIMDVEEVQPYRLVFKDGEVTTYFTQGKYNPYDSVINILNETSSHTSNFKIDDLMYNENVLTSQRFVEAIKQLKQAQPFKQWGLIDITNMKPPAIAPLLVGMNQPTNYGEMLKGIYPDQTKGDELYAWEKKDVGKKILVVDGYPDGQELLHNKIMLFDRTENGVRYTYAVIGTFNVSNHVENAEILHVFKLKPESKIATSIKESVASAIKLYPQYAIPLENAVFQSRVSDLFARTEFDIPLELSNKLIDSMHAGDIDASIALLDQIRKVPNDIANPMGDAKLDARLNRFKSIFSKLLSYPDAKEGFKTKSVDDLSQILLASTGKLQGKALDSNIRRIASPSRVENDVFENRVDEMKKLLDLKPQSEQKKIGFGDYLQKTIHEKNEKLIPATCLSLDLKNVIK